MPPNFIMATGGQQEYSEWAHGLDQQRTYPPSRTGPAAGFTDTESGVSMNSEVRHGATQGYASVYAGGGETRPRRGGTEACHGLMGHTSWYGGALRNWRPRLVW